ncbi:hypothetical protein Tco_0921087 [Tanacetum coccineum]
MNAILGVYTNLDEVTNLQCDYLETLEKYEHLENELSKSRTMSKSFEALQKHAINLELDLQQCKEKIKNDKSFKENQSKEFLKEREQYFEIQHLKAQLQDKGIAISELKKLIKKMKGKYVETNFEKSSVNRQPNAFKSQRQSVLGKLAIFSDSLEKKDFSKSKSVTKNNVSNDFLKPVNAQILPQNIKSILKNTNVIAPEMYMVGALIYLTASRPDIIHATCYCACYQVKPTRKHLNEDCTSMSSAEAEYVSLSACCAQVLWLRTQLTDYGFHFDKIPMYCDSKAAIAISCNPVQHSRTKHIDVRYHFIKEQVEKGIVELFFVGTEYQLADLFTKALSEDRFKYLVRRLGMRCLTPEELEVLANESA